MKTLLISTILCAQLAVVAAEFNPFDNASEVIDIDASKAAKDEGNAAKESTDALDAKEDEVLRVLKSNKAKTLEELIPDFKNEFSSQGKTEPAPGGAFNNAVIPQSAAPSVQAPSNTTFPAPAPVPEQQANTLKVVSGIKYHPEYEPYSIMEHDAEAFNKFVSQLKLPDVILQAMRNRYDSGNAAILNAMAYDYVEHKPEIAESFYKEALKHDFNFYDQTLRYADFLIRTGRPKAVRDLLEDVACYSYIQASMVCYYYDGVAQYLIDGNNQNSALNSARGVIKKAQDIWHHTTGL